MNNIEQFKENDRNRYHGLMLLLQQYKDNPTDEKKEEVRKFIYAMFDADEFIDFFLDNYTEVIDVDEQVEMIKERRNNDAYSDNE